MDLELRMNLRYTVAFNKKTAHLTHAVEAHGLGLHRTYETHLYRVLKNKFE